MKLKVVTSKADHNNFCDYVVCSRLKSHTWISILKILVVWLAIGLIFMSCVQFKAGKIELSPFILVIVISLAFLFYVALSRLLAVKIGECFTPNKDGIILGSKEYEITPEGIKETCQHGHSFYSWAVVEQVEEVNGAIYVFVDQALALIFTAESLEKIDFKDDLLDTLKMHT
ncbi:YcxB family protein [Microbulbifer sp. MLAF003]|uniref:YcxB family protein n=1 Tax=Microbulbifer sp. MLAF003 TaxID=3032582 RepID=UPI0024ACAB3C|nr:YcxB family protein [Microbulbifer sp. MLAF003]WHI53094.1 YcxB family protein [Microbulbifer sp. MLAF003]